MTHLSATRTHPSAVVSAQAKLADDVKVGPFAVIEGSVEIGPGCVIAPHVHLIGPITIGANNHIGTGTVFGGAPQHVGYKGERTAIEIGDGNSFRENVTIHRGMPVIDGTPGTGVTRIGSHNLFMAGSHVGHDCRVGSHGIYANNALLAGHVETADRVLISANTVIHQFCRIGRLALLSGLSGTSKDMPPFWMQQDKNRARGVNLIGMRRSGMASAEINAVREAFRTIYKQRMTIPAALERIEAKHGHLPVIQELLAFIRSSKRGIVGPGGFERDEDEKAAA